MEDAIDSERNCENGFGKHISSLFISISIVNTPERGLRISGKCRLKEWQKKVKTPNGT
jgi:hypothetical protein